MARRRQFKSRPEASVNSLYWSYDGRDELIRRMTVSLSALSREEIITLVCEASMRWPSLCRHVLMQTETDQPLSGLIGDIQASIEKATLIPERMLNHNFPYDDEEYEQVRIGLRKLIRLGHLAKAMDLAIETLISGSRQIEASDEGLMIDEVVECVKVVSEVVDIAGNAEEKQAWMRRCAGSDYLSILRIK